LTDKIAGFLSGSSPEALTVLLAAMPVSELRGAIPWATFVLNMNWSEALAWSLFGNIIPVPLILVLMNPAQNYLRKVPLFNRFFDWLFARTRRKGRLIEQYQAVGLALFVAVPLPVTGAWTGSIAAFLFGIRFVPAFIAICFGVVMAGTIVTLACQGFISFWDISQKFN